MANQPINNQNMKKARTEFMFFSPVATVCFVKIPAVTRTKTKATRQDDYVSLMIVTIR